MSMHLFKAMLKVHGKNIFSYAIGSVMYQWLIIWIFPSIAKSTGMNDLIKSMPASIQRAFGLQSGFEQIGGFLAGEFYGMLYVLILIIFTVMISIQLISRLVDNTSMAYLLSTPVSRVKIVATQICILLFGLFVICGFTAGGGLLGISMLIKNPNIDKLAFIQLNMLGLLLFMVVGGYSILISCTMNDEKKAAGIATGITIIFFALNLVSKLSDKLNWMKNITIFSLFNPQEIMKGNVEIWPLSTGLLLSAVLLFGLSIAVFKNRDLPL